MHPLPFSPLSALGSCTCAKPRPPLYLFPFPTFPHPPSSPSLPSLPLPLTSFPFIHSVLPRTSSNPPPRGSLRPLPPHLYEAPRLDQDRLPAGRRPVSPPPKRRCAGGRARDGTGSGRRRSVREGRRDRAGPKGGGTEHGTGRAAGGGGRAAGRFRLSVCLSVCRLSVCLSVSRTADSAGQSGGSRLLAATEPRTAAATVRGTPNRGRTGSQDRSAPPPPPPPGPAPGPRRTISATRAKPGRAGGRHQSESACPLRPSTRRLRA